MVKWDYSPLILFQWRLLMLRSLRHSFISLFSFIVRLGFRGGLCTISDFVVIAAAWIFFFYAFFYTVGLCSCFLPFLFLLQILIWHVFKLLCYPVVFDWIPKTFTGWVSLVRVVGGYAFLCIKKLLVDHSAMFNCFVLHSWNSMTWHSLNSFWSLSDLFSSFSSESCS